MVPEQRIRTATAADAPHVREIYRPYVESTPTSFETVVPGLDELAARIRAARERYGWFVFEENGEVLGYVYATRHRGRRAYQWATEVAVYVRSDQRRRRIAHALYTTLLETLARQGYRQALAGIALPNEPSCRFHAAMGFEPFAVYDDIGYKLGRWHTTEWWRRWLGESGAEPVDPMPLEEAMRPEELDELFARALAQAR